MTTLHLIAQYDGWIFSNTGKTVRKKGGTTRRTTDLHYLTSWQWLMPVYIKLCSECSGEEMKVVQSAILLGDIEVAGEGCGKIIQNQNYACENQNKTNCRPPGEPGPNGLLQAEGSQNNLQDNNLSAF